MSRYISRTCKFWQKSTKRAITLQKILNLLETFMNGRSLSKLHFQVTLFSYEAYFWDIRKKRFLPCVLFLVTAATLFKISKFQTYSLLPIHCRTCMQSFSSIHAVVSEEKIFEKVYGRRRHQVMTKGLLNSYLVLLIVTDFFQIIYLLISCMNYLSSCNTLRDMPQKRQ